MGENDHELEHSPLSCRIQHGGTSIVVSIFRIAGSGMGWSLEVTDEAGGSTVWEDTFATDAEALREFQETLKVEGIRSFRLHSMGADTLH